MVCGGVVDFASFYYTQVVLSSHHRIVWIGSLNKLPPRMALAACKAQLRSTALSALKTLLVLPDPVLSAETLVLGRPQLTGPVATRSVHALVLAALAWLAALALLPFTTTLTARRPSLSFSPSRSSVLVCTTTLTVLTPYTTRSLPRPHLAHL